MRQTLSDPLYQPRYDVTLDDERSMALARLQHLSKNQLISVFDFEQNPKNIFAVHEIVGMVDGSLATKMTVQFNLFGGQIFPLLFSFIINSETVLDDFRRNADQAGYRQTPTVSGWSGQS